MFQICHPAAVIGPGTTANPATASTAQFTG